MKKISVPVNKIAPQDLNLAKSPKAMADVEAILELSPEERKARLSQVSQKIAEGSATLYEEKVLAKLLSPGRAEWIKVIHMNLPEVEARLKPLPGREEPSLAEDPPEDPASETDRIPAPSSIATAQIADSSDRLPEMVLLSWDSKGTESAPRAARPQPKVHTYFKGFLLGVIGVSILSLGAWKTLSRPGKLRSEMPPQQGNTSAIPPDILQVAQTQLDKAQHEIRVGDFTQGESKLKEIIREYPGTPQAEEAYLIMAEAYRYRSQRPDKALQAYQAFLEKYPTSSQTGLVLLKMGFCYEDMEDKKNAIALYRSVLQRNGEKSRTGQLAAERLKALARE